MRRIHIFLASVLLSYMLLVLGRSNAAVPLSPQDARVLHIQAVAEVLNPEGMPTGTQRYELWFDLNTLDTHYVVETPGGEKEITVRQGRTVRTYYPGNKRLITNIAATDDAEMLNVADRFLEYKRALERGELQLLEESVIRDRPAVRVERQALSEPLIITTWLEQETFLPLEETFSTITPDGNRIPRETLIWTYPTIKHVARNELPPEVFSIDVPPDVTQVTNRYMTVTDAAIFAEFDVYYLGDSYNGLPLFGITYSQATGPGYADSYAPGQESLDSFNVVYADPFIPGRPRRPDQLSVVQESISQYCPREAAPGVPAVGEPVQVNGRQATLYDHGGGVDLELRLGSTLITIHGRDRRDVLQAAASLQRLN